MAFNLVSAEQIKAVNLDDPNLPEDGGSGMTIKVDTAANLTKENPILLKGQLGAESDTTYMKLGDGVTAWNDLEYIKANKSVQDAVGNVITDTYLKKTGDTATGDITAPNFVGHLKGNADSATNADKLDGYHENSFLRCRERAKAEGEDTLWSQIGIKEYDDELPKGISGTYSYGAVVSLPAYNTRLDIWYNHHCSANKDGLWYRSGFDADQQPWARLLDSNNYTNWTPTKTGEGASGTWGINISGTATKLQNARTISLTGDIKGSATFDGSSNVSIDATRPYVVGETRRYDVDLSKLDTTKFYPIIFEPDRVILRCEIHSPSAYISEPYNQNVISFRLLSNGWSDTPYSFSIDEYKLHTQNEITIGCIGKGKQAGYVCVWVRGGLKYLVMSNRKPTLYTENTTFTSEGIVAYTVGTNYYGGTGNKNIDIIFTPQETIKEGSWHNGTAYGLFEKATKDASGNVIADTYATKTEVDAAINTAISKITDGDDKSY